MTEYSGKSVKAKTTVMARTPTQRTNDKANSLVKVVVSTDSGKWISPARASTHSISTSAQFPNIRFEIQIEAIPPYIWSWTIRWDAKVSGLKESSKRGKVLKSFSRSGRFESNSKAWVAELGTIIGGQLEVRVSAGDDTFQRTVTILGSNPNPNELGCYLNSLSDVAGFDKIIAQETSAKHFISADGQPIVSFDDGYGVTQLTSPEPTYEQAWNWKENVKGGASLYQAKQREARKYLGQAKRPFTDEQLKLETWSRWNGGGYHVWDAKNNIWVRNDDMLCDGKTGNIGWNRRVEANKDMAESDLRERDQGTYNDPKGSDKSAHPWQYSGICYADHLEK